MQSTEVRKAFINFFKEKGHKEVSSSSIVPINDPTLLFTNSGMNQFKDVFLGTEKINYKTATSSQKCIRAGGKHNDLENVGFTLRHHTFFEMLGNFSFGDYFKKEAIEYAWELLTKVYGLNPDKLWITVHKEDTESENIWINNIGFPPERISKLTEDNFWSMGDTGPCGPCSEIFYDHGKDFEGDPPEEGKDSGDRYIEIYNLVFMQFNRDHNGKLSPLPNKCVDTGMGLERITAVMQSTNDNYQTDLFQPILDKLATLLDCKDRNNPSLRVIADHLRSSSFLIADGVFPSNEGRGYVLRRIIRRALRHAYKVNKNKFFSFENVYEALEENLKDTYSSLTDKKNEIINQLVLEENQFRETLKQGMKLFEDAIETSDGKRLEGEVIFKLYDTYGFPIDLTKDLASEKGLIVDLQEYDRLMEIQREQAQKSSEFESLIPTAINLDEETIFSGYDETSTDSMVKLIFVGGEPVKSSSEGECIIVLDKTPFYGEAGGQVGDQGKLISENLEININDTQKVGNFYLHLGEIIKGKVTEGLKVKAKIDNKRRESIVSNHSATHLMHSALRKVLGDHVEQKGSLVNEHKLRFDFSHQKKVSNSEINLIEEEVNSAIKKKIPTEIINTSLEKSQELGAIAFFDEKYGDEVRVLKIAGDFSIELCGGTHVKNSGDIKKFKIVSESSVSSGIRRLEAISGDKAIQEIKSSLAEIEDFTNLFNVSKSELPRYLKEKEIYIKDIQNRLNKIEQKNNQKVILELKDKLIDINGINVILRRIDNFNLSKLRGALDSLKKDIKNTVIILCGSYEEKSMIIASVSPEITDTYDARSLIDSLASLIEARGGGKPDFAQAGGGKSDNLDQVLQSAKQIIEKV